MRKIGLCFLASLCFAVRLAASTVTVAVAQNEVAPEIALETSSLIEDEIMGSLYDEGYIVSNNDISLVGTAYADPSFGIKDATEGFSDYLIAVLVEYAEEAVKDAERQIVYAEIRAVTWRLVRLSDGKVLAERVVDMKKAKADDPQDRARRLAKIIGRDCDRLLKKE